ncbi:MAG: cardiolipin synthase [Spirochaetaceae bacterium]|nr:cardiolipin synthase [Spirochaetaceae bacterium]
MRKLLKLLMSRFSVVYVLILFQLFVLLLSVFAISRNYAFISAIFWLLSFVMILGIINKHTNPAVKLTWALLIALVPVFGCMLYIVFGSAKLRRKEQAVLLKHAELTGRIYETEDSAIDKLEKIDIHGASQSFYITNATAIPLYEEEFTQYFSSGESFFETLVQELKKAEKYIFIEYFIIQHGIMWDTILDILRDKKAQGVDVRVIYDDVGSVAALPYGYAEKLSKSGIPCVSFNPYRPALRTILHNRDHRKICVIDGRTAFTGGINLADEYINCVNRFGHWKDSAIMLKGRAAFCFTLAFLELWNMYRNSDSDYNVFRPDLSGAASAVSASSASPTNPADSKTCAFVQPYIDSPLDDELTGEQVFLNIINQSAEYLYITTPYLIIDNELSTALCLAAKRNVDVRIITPFIPDKWLVHEMTRSYYYELVAGGVRIYEYTPGFMHAKNMVSDDLTATVGTFNMDYRSLYHHFECGVWLYNSSVIKDIKADFLKTLDVCREITPEYLDQTNVAKRLVRSLFKIFAPLL